MENVNSAADLRKAIRDLEEERSIREKNLKLQWDGVVDSLRPMNILKRSFHDIFPGNHTKSDLLESAVAVGSGLVSKKIFEGKSPGPIRKTAGSALQFGVTSLVAKNAHSLTSAGISLFTKIFKRKKEKPGY